MRATVAQQVGAEIRRLRRLRDLTLQELADKAGVDFSQLSKIERGLSGTSLDMLETIAKALGVSIRALFSVVDAKRARRRAAVATLPHA